MYICVYVSVNLYVCLCNVFICIECFCVCVCTFMCARVCACVCTCAHVCTFVCTCACMCVVCVYYTCVYVHTNVYPYWGVCTHIVVCVVSVCMLIIVWCVLVSAFPSHTLNTTCMYKHDIFYMHRLCHLTVYLNNRPVELTLSPTETIEELKKQASRMCGVSADLQEWVGWPSGLPDHVSL